MPFLRSNPVIQLAVEFYACNYVKLLSSSYSQSKQAVLFDKHPKGSLDALQKKKDHLSGQLPNILGESRQNNFTVEVALLNLWLLLNPPPIGIHTTEFYPSRGSRAKEYDKKKPIGFSSWGLGKGKQSLLCRQGETCVCAHLKLYTPEEI